MPYIDESEPLMALVFLALDHGIDSVRGGGPLVPFAIVESAEGRGLARFPAERLEDGVQQARQQVASATDVDRAVIAYDGYVTTDGARSDAIFVEGHERGQPSSLVFAQRYRPKGRLRKLEIIGNPGSFGDGEPLLR